MTAGKPTSLTTANMSPPLVIDGLQYCRWTREVFLHMREGGIDAIHATIGYHELFREVVGNITAWNKLFAENSDLILHARSLSDIRQAQASARTAILFGLQNCSALEDDLGLVKICFDLGVRFMQISYNRQSLLASGCQEKNDSGLTRMGEQAIREMNRTGIVVDLSHASERSCLQALACSERPLAISHAIPSFWHKTARSVSDEVLTALKNNRGLLGLSLYPYHLKNHGDCSREDFCAMVARLAEKIGIDAIGIGSDLCYGQPDSVLAWMRQGRWNKPSREQEKQPSFPPQPPWFQDNRDFPTLHEGLLQAGFSTAETEKITGGNWARFFEHSFSPQNNTKQNNTKQNNTKEA